MKRGGLEGPLVFVAAPACDHAFRADNSFMNPNPSVEELIRKIAKIGR